MLEVKSLSYSYSDKLIFRNTSFVSHPGKITIILGVSGTGKTTLFRLIANFLSPAEGEILWLGEPVQQTDVAYMQQKTYVASVADCIEKYTPKLGIRRET